MGRRSEPVWVYGDFNGDGKTDIIDSHGTVWLSTGTGFTASTTFSLPPHSSDQTGIMTGDFNGDGKTDLAIAYEDTLTVYLSTGTTFEQSGPQFSPYEGPIIADWNNDGASDIWMVNSTPANEQVLFNYKPTLLTSVSNGLGATTTATYGQLNNPSVYTKGSGASWPIQDMIGTQYVVSKIVSSSGVGNSTYETDYAYAGGKIDLSGRGFEGFSSVTITDPQTGIVKTTNYLTSFPFTGLVSQETETCPSTDTQHCQYGVTIKSTTNCYNLDAPDCSQSTTPYAIPLVTNGGTRYFVARRQGTVTSEDLDQTLMPTVTTVNSYDCDQQPSSCYGDVTEVKAVTTDPNNNVLWTKTTTNTYTDDANNGGDGNWLLGRLLSSNVESVFESSDTTRHTVFCYDLPYHPTNTNCAPGGNSGLVVSETVEPGASDATLTLLTTYSYDAWGNKVQVSVQGCQTPNTNLTCPTLVTRTTQTSYDTVYNQFPVTVTNAVGESETWGTATNPEYDPRFGTPELHTGPNLLSTTWSYDTFGRMLQEVRPDLTNSNYSYQYCSGVNGGTDATCPVNGPNGASGAFSAYDTELGKNGSQINPTRHAYFDMLSRTIAKDIQGFNIGCWVRQDTIYDKKGRLNETDRPYYLGTPNGCTAGTQEWTQEAYVIAGTSHIEDALGRVRTETRPDTGYTTYSYSGLSSTATEYLANSGTSEATTKVKNALGLIASVTDSNSKSTSYSYDGFGNLLSTLDPNQNSIVNKFDIRGRKRKSTDPDMGVWTYVYDSWSELYQQTDANNNLVTMSYDALGRPTGRSEPDMQGSWTYGTTVPNFDRLVQETCSGTACAIGGYMRVYKYDSKSREDEVDDTYGTTTYTATNQYDSNSGKITTVKAFSGLQTTNQYVSLLGYLSQIVDASSGFIYWQVTSRDAEMHATTATLDGTTTGTRIAETNGYDPTSGRDLSLCATTAASGCDGAVANFSYGWDTNGSLLSRADANESLSEKFCYDSLNRLTGYAVNPPVTATCSNLGGKSVSYDALGDVTFKSDVGTYNYAGSQPHAMSSIASCSTGCMDDVIANGRYFYDANGNLSCVTANTNTQCDANASRMFAYTSFNMTLRVAPGTGADILGLEYDPDHARSQMCSPKCSNSTTTTQYMNDANSGVMTELYTQGSNVTWRTYLQADGRLVALRSQVNNLVPTWSYFVTDNLDSPAVVAGANAGRLSYDAWGKMRNPNGTDDTNCILPEQSPTTRGFTGQEQIASLCNDNFNARIYNPLLGRFLTADSIVPDTYNLQSLNRYAYVDNKPLSETDPTGNADVGNNWQATAQIAWLNDAFSCSGSCDITVFNGAGYDSDNPQQVKAAEPQDLQPSSASASGINAGAGGAVINPVSQVTQANMPASGTGPSSSGVATSDPMLRSGDAQNAANVSGQNGDSEGSSPQSAPSATGYANAQGASGATGSGVETVVVCGNCDRLDKGNYTNGKLELAANTLPSSRQQILNENKEAARTTQNIRTKELEAQGWTVRPGIYFTDPVSRAGSFVDIVGMREVTDDSGAGYHIEYWFEEVKSGNSAQRLNQQLVLGAIESGRAIPGPSAAASALVPGVPIGKQIQGPIIVNTIYLPRP